MKLERKFEKELATDLRKETAKKLREVRKEPVNFSEFKKQKKELPIGYKNLERINNTFESLKRNVLGRILKTEKYKKDEFFINEVLSEIKERDIEEVKKEYNKKFNEILKNSRLSEEEKEKYLSTEAMEEMSLDDYLVLLKRLSGEAFYHVTRFGIRENTFVSTGGGHYAEEGNLVNSFEPLLEDGYIKSATSTIIEKKEESWFVQVVKKDIKRLKNEGKSQEEIIEVITQSYGTDSFLDRDSSHFSYGKDLHHMYGGENNYKFYFYYPVEYILQNDFFHKNREGQINIGKGYSLNRSGINQQYNDAEIFNFGKGVPINAGILCITGDAKVDPETGSQYLIKDGKPVLDKNGEFKKPEKTISSKEYWEKYFELHPELKPNKIIYGEFHTSSYDENEDLKNWAKSKEVWEQDKNKMDKFKEYVKNTREILKKIFSDVVQEEFKN